MSREAILSSSPRIPDYEALLSRAGRTLRPSPLIALVERDKLKPGRTICMSVGLPNALTYPVVEMQTRLSDGTVMKSCESTMREICNYGMSAGTPALLDWLKKLHRYEHAPPQLTRANHPSPFDLCIANGALQGLYCLLNSLVDVGDTVLVESAAYATMHSMIDFHCGIVKSVECDSDGILTSSLDQVLTNWTGNKKPRVIYIISSAHNPLGYTWSEQRIAEVYEVCRKHDLIILEDGAYHFLQFGKRNRSFQSLDVDARVMRFDSFSKIIGAGYRVGWASGPSALVRLIVYQLGINCHGASQISQEILYNTLKHWGHAGFIEHVEKTAKFYQQRAEVFLAAANKYLQGLATWVIPTGGMFTWLQMTQLDDSMPVVVAALERGLSVAPGYLFMQGRCISNAIRISFSSASDEDMDEAMRILGEAIRKVMDKNQVKVEGKMSGDTMDSSMETAVES